MLEITMIIKTPISKYLLLIILNILILILFVGENKYKEFPSND